ncbi:MAG TPA: iron ABC transporter ATP-binding protein, partial [Pseudomonas sp.]|nr:iron ABC transporter ATP-binding protein [Pseudomonas sp.]
PSHTDHHPGEIVGIEVSADHLVLFPAQGSVAANAALPTNGGVRRYSSAS